MELLSNSKPVPEGTVIMAEEQFAGRGQQKKVWRTEKGKNLTCSIVLFPVFLNIQDQFYLNMVVSLALIDFCEQEVESDFKIKWPNDIYYKDKKVAGILIENILQGSHIKSSVVGIGLNMNQENFIADLPNPISLKLISGKEFDIKESLFKLCTAIEAKYMQLKTSSGRVRLREAYIHKLFCLGEDRKYIYKDEQINGKITGIDAFGRLILQTKTKELHPDLKELQYCF